MQLMSTGANLLLITSSPVNNEIVLEKPKKCEPERYVEENIALQTKKTIPFIIG